MSRGFHHAATVTAAAVLAAGALGLSGLASPLAGAAPLPNIVDTWGAGALDQLGSGSTADASVPTLVTGTNAIQQLATGDAFTVALLDDGTVWAWGDNPHGQLGDGTTTSSAVPVAVSGLPVGQVARVSAGGDHAMALLRNGTIMAWGDNSRGQLGDGTTTDSHVPEAVPGLTGVRQVQAGGDFSLALVAYGTVKAWGANDHGQLGNGTTTNSPTPVDVAGLTNDVREVSAGSDFGLAVMAQETVEAWGDGGRGQLGNGAMSDSDVPVPVSGLAFVRSISAGGAHGLALLPFGQIASWGADDHGQLGDGATTDNDIPQVVSGISNVAALAAGGSHSLVLLRSRTIVAWGDNAHGQLGIGTTTDSHVPVAVPSVTGVTGISAGADFSIDKGINLAPVIMGPRKAVAFVGLPLAVTIRVRSHPAVSAITETGALPSGLTFVDHGNNSASVTGTPATGTAGTYLVQISATSAPGGTTTKNVVLVVKTH